MPVHKLNGSILLASDQRVGPPYFIEHGPNGHLLLGGVCAPVPWMWNKIASPDTPQLLDPITKHRLVPEAC